MNRIQYIGLVVLFAWTNCLGQMRVSSANKNVSDGEVIYHVFQRSFYDSDGDGHGDLAGLRKKLDYIEDLGATSILTTPLYSSIYYHNYFPDDFRSIDPAYGTLKDYLSLLKAIHKKGMRYYMDMEIHYITKNHVWFKSSFNNPSSEFSNYVHYNGPDNTSPESMIFNLTSLESYNGESVEITTVNLENEKVKTYIYDLFKYWVDPNMDGKFDDGVDGFRIDHMMDDLDWKGLHTNMLKDFWAPLFVELRKINPAIKILGEQANWNDPGLKYFQKGQVDWMFGFAAREAFVSKDKVALEGSLDTLWQVTPSVGSQLIFIENHDLPRYATVVNQDPALLKLGAFFNVMSKGIPVIYYGQEIGMRGMGGFNAFGTSDGNDIPRREAFEWYSEVEGGKGMALWYKDTGPWWDQTNLKSNDGISLEEQRENPVSLFNSYRQLIEIRKQYPVFWDGSIKLLETSDDHTVAYLLENETDRLVACLNLSESATNSELDLEADSKLRVSSLIKDRSDTKVISTSDRKVNLQIAGYGFILLQVQ